MSNLSRALTVALALLSSCAAAASPDRITRPVNPSDTVSIAHHVPRMAQPRYDQGAVAGDFPTGYIMLMVKPSAAQQSELETLLAGQQNPSSPQFHKWLTPEVFGDRFGLNSSDHSKLLAWLQSEGFTIQESARARNWIAFGGTAVQVEHALHTSIHRYRVNGETHFANASDPAVPAAFAGIVAGFIGLHDFNPKPLYTTSGGTHFLAPEDWATIYDVTPLDAAGIDGTGVNIGIIGGTQLALSDIQMFRSQYNLPASAPKTQLVGTNPGTVSADLTEADLDIEWAGAVAPGANIYFYYSAILDAATAAAINANVVQIISMSFGSAESNNPILTEEPMYQQANAQGITVLASSGDYGATNRLTSTTDASLGPTVASPASFPEITAVGGTQFNEGSGSYWAATNDANGGSALSYIPEIAWSDGGGGASVIFSKPAWQTGPGVPADGARDSPDIAFTAAAGHDPYYIVTGGSTIAVGGTSASAPSMAGVVALLNHYLVANGNLAQPGLGNINPQLYRLAQIAPSTFHTITGGSNIVTCEQGSPDCATGSFGYTAGPGYNQATGLGSLDVNNFVTAWTMATNTVSVTFSATPSAATFNDTFQLTATVASASGAGTPTGIVDFAATSLPLGSVTLDASSGVPTATLSVPGYLLNPAGTFLLTAQYRGDAAFSGGGATASVKVSAPTGAASIVPAAPLQVSAQQDVTGMFWQFSVTLNKRGGVAAVLTGFTMDGQAQPLAQYFPAVSIPPDGSITSQPIVLRNLVYAQAHTFGFSGVDAHGNNWSRQIAVTFLAPPFGDRVLMTAVPLTVQQDPDPASACPWAQQVILSEAGGFAETITGVTMGNISLSSQIPAIFGTDRLAAYRSLEGNLCWSNAAPGTSDTLKVTFASGLSQSVTVFFAPPAVNPAVVSVSPTSIALPAQNLLSLNVPDGQSWTASIYPQNVSTNWLTLSQASGSGAAQITLSANPTSFETGIYFAMVVIQGPNTSPPAIIVPVMFLNGNSSVMTISGLTNAASGQIGAAPGMVATITGTALASRTVTSNAATFTYSVGGVPSGFGLTVNGIPAAFEMISPTQINFQIPYETGSGPAVVGVNNDGSLGGFLFNVTPTAPGIYAPASTSVQAGKALTITMTGDGVVNTTLADGVNPAGTALGNKPSLPFTVTIGGIPAFVTSYGIAQGAVGITTVNLVVPDSVPAGPQPIVVTTNGVSSPPVNVNVTAAP